MCRAPHIFSIPVRAADIEQRKTDEDRAPMLVRSVVFVTRVCPRRFHEAPQEAEFVDGSPSKHHVPSLLPFPLNLLFLFLFPLPPVLFSYPFLPPSQLFFLRRDLNPSNLAKLFSWKGACLAQNTSSDIACQPPSRSICSIAMPTTRICFGLRWC